MNMSQRDHDARKERLAFIAAEESLAAAEIAREQERKLKPLREAEAAYKSNLTALAALERDHVAKGRDDSFQVDEAVRSASMSMEAAQDFNSVEFSRFADSAKDAYLSEQNIEAITDYLDRNGVMISNAATYRLAYDRLLSYGLLESAPAPAPQQTSRQWSSQNETEFYEPESQPIVERPDPNVGIDVQTGEPRRYSDRELSGMSATAYRIAFQIPTLNRPGEYLR